MKRIVKTDQQVYKIVYVLFNFPKNCSKISLDPLSRTPRSTQRM